MKQLIIVRHGKSDWSNASLADIDRPLKNRGVNDGNKMGERLKSRKTIPDIIITSPANRAHSTALIIARVLGIEKDNLLVDEEIYLAGTRELIKMIRKFDNRRGSVMIVGHNPGFTYLANHFLTEYIDNVPTTGIVTLNFDTDNWAKIDPGNVESDTFDFPKNE